MSTKIYENMKDENIYRKLDNGRYQAFGVCYQPEHLCDGIWYVKHHEYGRSITSVPYVTGLFRIGDTKEIDIPTLCGLEDICNKIYESQEYRDLINSKNGYCIQDIVHICVKKMYDFSQEKKNGENGK